MDFAIFVYKLSENFPVNEKFGFTSQILRAVILISANITEGYGRNSSKEFL